VKLLTKDGIELYFEKSGNGIPCLFLHGGPGYWSKSFQFFSEELLEKSLAMVYLDQRGCGRSGHDVESNYSLSRLIDDIEELRNHLSIDEWYVMGHSFGGILAVNYAQRFPQRTKGIILSNVTLNMADSFRHQIEIGSGILGLETHELPTNDIASLMDSFYSTLTKLIEKEAYYRLQFVDLENKRILDKIDATLNTDPNFQQYIFTSKEYFQDFTSLTDKISKPVLVLTGEYDHAVGPLHYQNFKFKNQEIHVLNCAHHPYIENQIKYRNTILNFLQK